MKKDFKTWGEQKESIDCQVGESNLYFKEGDIWWSRLGANIGYEQDGKGGLFSRPIIVLKKFNQYIFWAIPLSTKHKSNPYYVECISQEGEKRTAIISQIRLMSVKRLINKIGFTEEFSFKVIRKAVKDLL
ncbi:MAG: hypothetical protein RLZZ67_430 [Candidatus Parcubacteria bacterium]|jgi:mRNA interferase MazF